MVADKEIRKQQLHRPPAGSDPDRRAGNILPKKPRYSSATIPEIGPPVQGWPPEPIYIYFPNKRGPIY